jgi:hypothetical protein
METWHKYEVNPRNPGLDLRPDGDDLAEGWADRHVILCLAMNFA